ncbi:MAG: YwiC-like family protein [Polyangiaceae bacterium]|jgi:hypothetical protein|nr:YwiC-like family protein [Polyangiaceae bacterium]
MIYASMSSESAPRRVRSLAPREHGAYGQLGVPLVVALAAGRPAAAGWLLAAASVAAFTSHEPMQVLLGRRGSRALREDGARAKKALWIRGAGALLLGGAGLALASGEARLAALLPGLLALVTLGLLWRGQERSVPGEIVAAAALAGAGVPVAVSAGETLAKAAAAWGVWALGFGAVTFAVRAVVSRDHSGARWVGPVAVTLLAAAAQGAGLLSAAELLAAAPLLAAALGLTAAPPEPARLKVVGWVLVAASLLAGTLLARA